MQRRRMVSPEIWKSLSSSKLTIFARLVFIGLISNADDEGRGNADPAYLRSQLFPSDRTIRVRDISNALSEITQKVSVQIYADVDGNSYYTLTKWALWQNIPNPTPSKIPSPPTIESMGERGSYMQKAVLSEDDLARDLENKNKINGVKLNNITTTHACARARTREITVDDFENALDCCGWEHYPTGDVYREIRDTLLDLLNNDEISLDDLSHDLMGQMLNSMFIGRVRREIVNLQAYLLAIVQRQQKNEEDKL